jgi:hypothetical protein
VIRRLGLAGALVGVLALAAAPALADSFTPVVLTVSVPASGGQGVALPVSVTVSADPGVLDTSEGPMRIGVKLATGDCGGTFETTTGATLLDAQLDPQPTSGKAYSATASGSGKPTVAGGQTICVFLEDADVHRVYANDESQLIDVKAVSAACRGRAATYASAARALARARTTLTRDERRLKTAQRTLARARRHRARDRRAVAARRRAVTKQKRTVAARNRTVVHDRTLARASCGAALPL